MGGWIGILFTLMSFKDHHQQILQRETSSRGKFEKFLQEIFTWENLVRGRASLSLGLKAQGKDVMGIWRRRQITAGQLVLFFDKLSRLAGTLFPVYIVCKHTYMHTKAYAVLHMYL